MSTQKISARTEFIYITSLQDGVLAIREKSKFLRFLPSSTYPSFMDALFDNMLKTSILDKELKANGVNEFTIIDALSYALRWSDPRLLKEVDESVAEDRSGKIRQRYQLPLVRAHQLELQVMAFKVLVPL